MNPGHSSFESLRLQASNTKPTRSISHALNQQPYEDLCWSVQANVSVIVQEQCDEGLILPAQAPQSDPGSEASCRGIGGRVQEMVHKLSKLGAILRKYRGRILRRAQQQVKRVRCTTLFETYLSTQFPFKSRASLGDTSHHLSCCCETSGLGFVASETFPSIVSVVHEGYKRTEGQSRAGTLPSELFQILRHLWSSFPSSNSPSTSSSRPSGISALKIASKLHRRVGHREVANHSCRTESPVGCVAESELGSVRLSSNHDCDSTV